MYYTAQKKQKIRSQTVSYYSSLTVVFDMHGLYMIVAYLINLLNLVLPH